MEVLAIADPGADTAGELWVQLAVGPDMEKKVEHTRRHKEEPAILSASVNPASSAISHRSLAGVWSA